MSERDDKGSQRTGPAWRDRPGPVLRADVIGGEKPRCLYRYWEGKRQGRRMPRRADIDPLDLRNILPHLFLVDVDVVADPPLFRFRLVGTALDQQTHANLTGTTVMPPAAGQELGSHHAAFVECVRRRAPFYHCSRTRDDADGDESAFERLVLPLSSDGEAVDVLIGVVEYRNLLLRRDL